MAAVKRRNEAKYERQAARAKCEACGRVNFRHTGGNWFLMRLFRYSESNGKPHFFCPDHAPEPGAKGESDWY